MESKGRIYLFCKIAFYQTHRDILDISTRTPYPDFKPWTMQSKALTPYINDACLPVKQKITSLLSLFDPTMVGILD